VDFRALDNQWFALQVRARYELLCARILRSKGYEEFLPLCRIAAGRKSKDTISRAELRPLFPGYLFCRLKENPTGLVLTTPGVIRVVGYGRVPNPIPDEQIANLRSVVDSTLQARAWPYLKIGQRVRLVAGPLRGVEGFLTKLKDLVRFVVSIDLLQRSTAVEVDAAWVVPASPVVSDVQSHQQFERQHLEVAWAQRA
jgi:transcription antitermination factor NusG